MCPAVMYNIADDHLVLFIVMFYSGGLALSIVRSLNIDISLQ